MDNLIDKLGSYTLKQALNESYDYSLYITRIVLVKTLSFINRLERKQDK